MSRLISVAAAAVLLVGAAACGDDDDGGDRWLTITRMTPDGRTLDCVVDTWTNGAISCVPREETP